MLSAGSRKSNEWCVIRVIGFYVIVAFKGRLLALFKCSKSKFPCVDPLSVFASAKCTFFHGWQVFVGVGGAGFVCRSLLSFVGRRRKVFSYYCVIGALLG